MNRGEIKSEVLVRSGKDTTSAWTSEAFLNDWINQAHRWAAGFKPWVYSEGRVNSTYTSATEEWLFEGYKADSIRVLTIGGKRFGKITFEDYQQYKEDEPSGTDKVFTDYGRSLWVNTLTGCTGTITAYGQYQPADFADGDGADSLDTVFSPNGDEGNEAIIEKVLGNIYTRDDKQQATIHYQMAEKQLNDLWIRTMDEAYKYQTKDRGMFKDFDILEGDYTDNLFKRNQFN